MIDNDCFGQQFSCKPQAEYSIDSRKVVHFDKSLEQICFFDPLEPSIDVQKDHILIVQDNDAIQFGSITNSLKTRFQYNTHFGILEIIDITIKYRNLYILVWVPNYSYEKTLYGRITQDEWKSCENIPAHYLYSNDSKTKDCFQIALPIKESSKKIEFCLYFECGNLKLWEKDLFGKNFVVYIQQYIDNCHSRSKKKHKNYSLSSLHAMQALNNFNFINQKNLPLITNNDQNVMIKRVMESYFPLCF